MNNMIDRETYRSIKRMSREQLMDFLERYANHMIENKDKIIDLRLLEHELSKINGIGKKRLDEIMTVIEGFFN